jgi:hypothetical protein
MHFCEADMSESIFTAILKGLRESGYAHSPPRQKRGWDFTPLFQSLVNLVGQQWDVTFNYACSRLDTIEPVSYPVELHEQQQQDLVRVEESSYFPNLLVEAFVCCSKSIRRLQRKTQMWLAAATLAHLLECLLLRQSDEKRKINDLSGCQAEFY